MEIIYIYILHIKAAVKVNNIYYSHVISFMQDYVLMQILQNLQPHIFYFCCVLKNFNHSAINKAKLTTDK